jgi:VWFA-related protein
MVFMKRSRLGGAVVLALVGAGIPAAPKEDSERPQEFGVSAEQVSVDFVVYTKKGVFAVRGDLINDLAPSEVQVFEDGVRQDVESLRLVRRGNATVSGSATANARGQAPPNATPVVAPQGPELLAVVFDNVPVENRPWARKIVTEYFNEHWRDGEHVGVFALGQRLAVAQPFTGDKQAAIAGVERALGWQSAEGLVRRSEGGVLGSVNDRLRGAASLVTGPAGGNGVPSQGEPGARGPGGPPNTDILLSGLLSDRPEATALRHDVDSLTSLRSLVAIVNAMSAAQGRKAIVYMADSLSLGALAERFLFRQLVPAANDAHVSIYTVDASGLAVGGGPASGPALPTIELPSTNGPSEPMRTTVGEYFNTTNDRAMYQVADATGGKRIWGTNNLALGIEEADADLTSYYLLSYSPKNNDYDGRFREIKLKVLRPHGELRARKGYIAVKTRTWDSPVLAYEGPALARLDRDPKADQFPIHAQALAIPSGSEGTVAAVLAEFRAGDLSREKDRKAKLFREDFTIVAVIRDASGRVVKKLSDYYPMKGALDRIDDASRRKVLFYREAELAPGAYTVDVVVRDNRKGDTSIRHLPLQVPDAEGDRLRASSLVLVGTSGLAGGGRAAQPFVTNGVQLFPSLDDSVTTDASGRAVVFLRAWTAPARRAVDASLELKEGDREIADSSLGRLRPDASGRVDVLARFPVAPLPAGNYQVRVTLRDGRDTETRSASFRLDTQAKQP